MQIKDCINEFSLSDGPSRLRSKRELKVEFFSLVLIEVINFVNEVHRVLMATITRAQLKRRERWKLMCAWNRNYTVIHSNGSWLWAFKMLFLSHYQRYCECIFKGVLKIALMRSMEHVASLFLFKSVISVNQSRNGFRHSLSESRRVFKKVSIFEKERGYFTWSWLVARPLLSNNTPISCVIVSKEDPKRYYEFIS